MPGSSPTSPSSARQHIPEANYNQKSLIGAGTPDVRILLREQLMRSEEDARACRWLIDAVDASFPQGDGPGLPPLPPEINRVVQGVLNYVVNSRY